MHNLSTAICGQVNSATVQLLTLNHWKENHNKPHRSEWYRIQNHEWNDDVMDPKVCYNISFTQNIASKHEMNLQLLS